MVEPAQDSKLLKKRKANIDLSEFYPDQKEQFSTKQEDQSLTKRFRRDCPYLGQIKRYLLDFDFEKLCSVTLSNLNIYSCLVCGKYYQGKGKGTQAYQHSLAESHNVFINLNDGRIYCLPDNYEVVDSSLNDIKYNLLPQFTEELISKLDSEPLFARGLDGTDFYPGCLGLNNLKQTDFVNVVIQAMSRIKPLRNYCLLYNVQSVNQNNVDHNKILFLKLSELIKKIWNIKNFKGHVSPHELLQAISLASDKRFKIGEQKDPITFIPWFLNALSQSFKEKDKKSKVEKNIIEKTFQGCLEYTQLIPKSQDLNLLNKRQAMKTNVDTDVQFDMKNSVTKFFFLTLDLPAIPLFKEQQQLGTIPQVPLAQLLKKFDGKSFIEEAVTCIKRKYKIYELPQYLMIHIKRFTKNDFFVEKNPTIVNFPIKNLDLSDYVWQKDAKETKQEYKYDLIANIIHEGRPDSGLYKVQVLHKPTDEWFDIQDLHVNNIMPQQVTVSEAYILVFERQLNQQ